MAAPFPAVACHIGDMQIQKTAYCVQIDRGCKKDPGPPGVMARFCEHVEEESGESLQMQSACQAWSCDDA